MQTEVKNLIDFLSSRDNENICNVLNEYFGQDGIREFLDSDNEESKKFIESVCRIHTGLKWFLDRISLIKQQKITRKRERTDEGNIVTVDDFLRKYSKEDSD